MEQLKRNDIKKGFLWNAVEVYAGQIVQFAIGIIMARLLMPDDYAIIGMITVFICISNVLISSGFTASLLRKQDCTPTDKSTVFWCNTGIAVALFGILWFCAPLIADFYGYPILTPVTRVMGLTCVVGSFGSVSETLLKKELRFKSIATITLSCAIVTGVIAIIAAYHGYGIWALVLQALALAVIRAILVIVAAHWRPGFVFSAASFKELFGFGSKVLGSNLITQIYQNMYNITIGKFYPAASLAYFTRADGYSKLVPNNIAGVIQKALFPLISKIQDDKAQLVHFNAKMARLTSYLIFPASLIMAGLAYPLISVMITDKWLGTAPLLQILCISVLPEHLYYINNDFIMVRGRSDYVMREQTWTKLISVGVLAASLPFGLEWVAVGKGLGCLLTWVWSARYLRKTLGITLGETVRDLWKMLAVSVVIGLACWVAFLFLSYTLINLIWVGLAAIGVYVLASKLFFPETLSEILHLKD